MNSVVASLIRFCQLTQLFELYIVGGAVRDMLQKIHPKDYDLTGPYTPAEFTYALESHGVQYWTKHEDYGVIEFLWEGQYFEYTTFMSRVERAHELRLAKAATGLSSKQIAQKVAKGEMQALPPQVEVEFTLLRERDEKRRDFTCNALYYDLRSKSIANPNPNWAIDASLKILNWIGTADGRCSEDPSRILRWVRFWVRGYSIGDNGHLPIEVVQKYSRFIPVEKFLQEAEKLGPQLFPRFWDELWDLNALDHLNLTYTELIPDDQMWEHWVWILYAQSTGARDAWTKLKLSKEVWNRYEDISLEDCDSLPDNPPLSWLRRLKDKLKVLSLKDLYEFWGVDLPLNIDDPKLNEEPHITGDDLIAQGHKPGPSFKRLLQTHLDAQMDR